MNHPSRRRAQHRLGAVVVSFLSSLSLTALAQEPASPPAESSTADPVVECLSDHTEGQQLRRDGKLIESRDTFRQCSATACPSQIIRDCYAWMEETNRQIPSVSVTVTADGVARADVQVYIDGVLAAQSLSGRAIDVNPGPHQIRVVLPPFEPFEEQIVVTEGEKFRVVNVNFTTPGRQVARPGAPRSAPPPEVEMARPVPISTYVFGGIGIAAAISGGAWGISNMALRSDMEDKVNGCAPNCSDRSIEVLKQRALLADISWGVSIVSLATAATIYFLRPEEPVEPPIAVDLHLVPSGAVGTLSLTRF